MSVRYADFQGEIILTAKIHYANTNLNAELQAVATALASDTTTHDRTIETPAAALAIGNAQTRLTNDILHCVNIGKAGNLPNATMVAAIDGVIGALKPARQCRRALCVRRRDRRPGLELHARQLGRDPDLIRLSMEARRGDQHRDQRQHLYAGRRR